MATANISTKNLKLGHVNIRSLLPSLDSVSDSVHRLELDILGVTETWLSERISGNSIEIDGYNFFRNDRETRGGGVGIYIKNNIVSRKIDIENSESIEQLWLVIKVNNIEIGLGVFYRPPKSNLVDALQHIETALATIIPMSDEIFILGDMNVNLLNYNNATISINDFLTSFSLKQLTAEPTRIVNNQNSLIDYIITSNDRLIVGKVLHHDMHEETDHQLTFCTLNCIAPREAPKIIKYRNFKYFDSEMFHADLINTHWYDVLEEPNVENKVMLLTDKVRQLFDRHAPLCTVRITKQKAPWFTDVLRIMKKERNKLMSKYKKTRKECDWAAYKNMRNIFTQAVRNEKRSYLEYICKSTDRRVLWKSLNGMNIYRKAKTSRTLPKHLCNPNSINDFFLDSINKLALTVDSDIVKKYENGRGSNHVFQFRTILEVDVLNAISNLKSNSCGFDGLSLQMIKLCSPVIIPFLAHIFNECITSRVYPTQWKVATVTPIPKINNPGSFSDLRPISLLPTLSKIFEKTIYIQLVSYLNDSNLIPPTQSGFRKGYSAASVLLSVLDDIISAADEGRTSALIMLDYSKAFDTLDHMLLCAKLRYYGFSVAAVNFFHSYLVDRSQFVSINGNQSEAKFTTKGVPQGSILGPLLFIIYTMDMAVDDNHCKMHRYADDTQLHLSFRKSEAYEAQNKVEQCLEKIYTYSSKNGLKLNPTKSVIVYFGPNNNWAAQNMKIKMSDSIISVERESKYLGLIFDSQLRFRSQVSKVVRASFISLRNLYKNKDFLNYKLKKQLCEALVLSQSNYCNFVYGPCLDQKSKRQLQKVQNSCIRLIYGLRSRDHVTYKLDMLNWLNIEDRQKLHFACFLHRILRNGFPEYLTNKLKFRYSNYAIRQCNNMEIPKHRTALYQRSFSYLATKMYNSNLNLYSLDLKTFTFKTKLKTYMLSGYRITQ